MSKRNAYVWLVMRGDAYVPGALVSAHSVRNTKTKHELVCMVTSDVSKHARAQLAFVFDHVREVDYLSAPCRPMRTKKQTASYGAWIEQSFTKWRCLEFTEYDKVLFVDCDKLVLSNVDELFTLPAPAGTFSLPWARPFTKNGIPNPYYGLKHGERVRKHMIEDGLGIGAQIRAGFVVIGTMVLLEPSKTDFRELKYMLARQKPFGFPNCHNGFDEQSLVFLYYEKKLRERQGRDWRHIHQSFNAYPWKVEWQDPEVPPRVFHYFSSPKPWDLERGKYMDAEVWWSVAQHLVKQAKTHKGTSLTARQQSELKSAFSEEIDRPAKNGCSWCEALKLPGHKRHDVFDATGKLQCPVLSNHQKESKTTDTRSRKRERSTSSERPDKKPRQTNAGKGETSALSTTTKQISSNAER